MSFATFGLVVADGKIVDAPPIARYTLGWPWERAVTYFAGREATVRYLS